MIEQASKRERIDIGPILDQLPDGPIVCACTVLNAQMQPRDDSRWINPNELLARYVVHRSYEGNLEDQPLKREFVEDTVTSSRN